MMAGRRFEPTSDNSGWSGGAMDLEGPQGAGTGGMWHPPPLTGTSNYALRASADEKAKLNWLPQKRQESWWPKNKAIGDCTVEQLRVKLAGQQKLLANRKMMAALPDGGAKIAARCDELEEAIAAAEALEAAIKAEEPDAGAAVEHPDVLSTSSLTVTERPAVTPGEYVPLAPDSLTCEVAKSGASEAQTTPIVAKSRTDGAGDSASEEAVGTNEETVGTNEETVETKKGRGARDEEADPGPRKTLPPGETSVRATQSASRVDAADGLDEITGLMGGLGIAADSTGQRIMHTVMHGTVAPKLKDWEDPKNPLPRTTMISLAESMEVENTYRMRRREVELEKAAAMIRWREEFPEGSSAFGSAESKACIDRLLGRPASETPLSEESDRADLSADVEAPT